MGNFLSNARNKIESFMRDRYPWDVFTDFAKHQAHKPLPPHVSWWHTFGSLAVFLLVNQIVTGILLMVYYRPTSDHAFDSIKFIQTEVPAGWLIRGLHSWGATLMIVMLILHMIRVFVMGSYKKPRELTWVTGVFLLGVTVTFGFTGYLLPWNQLSYWATTVGTEVSRNIPVIGNAMTVFLRGGEGISGETLARFYVLHVVVLPWVVVGLVAVHLFLMRVQNLATMDPVGSAPSWPKDQAIRFFPEHVLKEMSVFTVFLGLLLALVIFSPPELGEPADPLNTPAGIKPEWYFLPTYQLLKYFPKTLGIFTSMLPPLLLLILPFIDRSLDRHPKRRPLAMTLGAIAVAASLILGVVGKISESHVQFLGKTYEVDLYGRWLAVHDETSDTGAR
ncbi:cytochrome bc complex cytochrome b subunit [bacterium]|nr:cytochrome bc complex cytochrome b subunit [bacterium]